MLIFSLVYLIVFWLYSRPGISRGLFRVLFFCIRAMIVFRLFSLFIIWRDYFVFVFGGILADCFCYALQCFCYVYSSFLSFFLLFSFSFVMIRANSHIERTRQIVEHCYSLDWHGRSDLLHHQNARAILLPET